MILVSMWIVGAFIALICFIIVRILKSPFKYPYFEHKFDVSGKRKPEMDDYIDQYIINGGFTNIKNHLNKVERWKRESQQIVDNSRLRNYRDKQFHEAIDDSHEFKFYFVKDQTRYRQSNYIRTSYKVQVEICSFTCDYPRLLRRFKKLEEINFEATLKDYHSTTQRKLMTRELREKIMRRDNYTCQKCGKYMPDGVGLQIDHIVPIVKGGKSVESNLQVLCSKCNGSKSGK